MYFEGEIRDGIIGQAWRGGTTWAEFGTQTLSKYCYQQQRVGIRPLLHANVEIYPLPAHLKYAQIRLPSP